MHKKVLVTAPAARHVIKRSAPACGLYYALLLLTAIFIGPLPLYAQERSAQHQRYCLELEAQLAKGYYKDKHTATEDRAKLRMNARNVERIFHRLSNEAERRGCYAYFLFSKELRRTPRCIRIDKKIRTAKHRLRKLNNALNRAAKARSGTTNRQSALIRTLARNNCGVQYKREVRRRQSNWFSEGIFGLTPPRRDDYDRGPRNDFKFATHRTLCVRLCDGYYFPVSFATTSNRFSTDEDTCRSRCAAPARLYTYPNPGGDARQMLSTRGVPYDNLKNAWRYRKEYVKGCSCKTTEYDPELLIAKPKLDKPPAKTPKKAKPPDEPEKEAKLGEEKKVGALDE